MHDLQTHSSNDSAIYLLRTVQQHHVQLSAMADQKASIIIGAAFVVLTMILGQASQMKEIPLSILILGGTAILSGLMAAMAVMPRVGKAPKMGRNPLFFGHFHDLTEDVYVQHIRAILQSESSVHDAMARDIYQMGTFLWRCKFAYLSWSYRLLIAGGAAATGVFVAERIGWL